MSEANSLTFFLYEISHFLTFDVNFNLFVPTLFLRTELLLTQRGSIKKLRWLKICPDKFESKKGEIF